MPGSKRILPGMDSNSHSEEEFASLEEEEELSPGGSNEKGSGNKGAGDGPGYQGPLQDPAVVEDVWD